MLKNSPTRYGAIAKSFHWIVALAIIAMIPFGWYMSDLEPSPDKYALYGLHKSIGIMVLILMVCRFLWRQYNRGLPQANPAHPQWERALANTVHYALYALAFLMPLTGWGMSSAGGHPVLLFGLPVPPLVAPDKELGALFNSAHSLIAWGIIVLVALHVLGALKHHFLDKDGTLLRMLPGVSNKRDNA